MNDPTRRAIHSLFLHSRAGTLCGNIVVLVEEARQIDFSRNLACWLGGRRVFLGPSNNNEDRIFHPSRGLPAKSIRDGQDVALPYSRRKVCAADELPFGWSEGGRGVGPINLGEGLLCGSRATIAGSDVDEVLAAGKHGLREGVVILLAAASAELRGGIRDLGLAGDDVRASKGGVSGARSSVIADHVADVEIGSEVEVLAVDEPPQVRHQADLVKGRV